ncbi:hypothetical protein B0H14DRAFT_2639943 [Mycena olivaceomarginata]|nr:hypothetical protein B0H14DRAFT_2639943 [Mycena olivaceomarginata]
MPFELKKGRKSRASDADYAPPSSVKRTRTAAPSPQLTPLTSTNHPGPQLEKDFPSDDPLPPSSAPGSPIFWTMTTSCSLTRHPAMHLLRCSCNYLHFGTHLFLKTPPTSPSGGGPLTSPFRPSPVKAYGGGLAYPLRIAILEAQETAAHVEAQMLQLEAERDAAQKRDRAKQRDVYSALEHLTPHGQRPKTTAMVTKALRTHGPELLDKWVERAPESVDAFLSKRLADLGLGMRLKEMAPTWWEVLTAASSTHSPSTEVPETRRDRSLKANNFQAVIALFLLGSGASKREIEVFAHAGISLSYKSVTRYAFASLRHECMVKGNCRHFKITEQIIFVV